MPSTIFLSPKSRNEGRSDKWPPVPSLSNYRVNAATALDYGFLGSAPPDLVAFRAASREISWPAASTQ